MLEVRNLSKRYGEKQAIDSISFSIEGKQAVGFLGINGAGKTTTMNILTGYLSASDGDVIIDGIDVLTDPLKAKQNWISSRAASCLSGYDGKGISALYIRSQKGKEKSKHQPKEGRIFAADHGSGQNF